MSHTPGPWEWRDEDESIVNPDRYQRWIAGGYKQADWPFVMQARAYHGNDAGIAISEADVRLIVAAPTLYTTLKQILAGFECGVFVRDVTHDNEPDWAMKLIPFLKLLGEAQAAVAEVEGRS
jgi:hypothetical protein